MEVSIHALTRRATERAESQHVVLPVSIHALTRRATVATAQFSNKQNVSIHALTRRATFPYTFTQINQTVSIHALTRRATEQTRVPKEQRKFQSTPSRGGRPMPKRGGDDISWFQSTPSRGGRLYSLSLHASKRYSFNPRPHAEGDVYCIS